MSIFQVSKLGSPSTIHSAITRPTPPAPAMPCAQNPAATKSPCTSLSPSTNSLSGVKPSGSVDQLDDLDVLDGGHAPDRLLDERREPVPVFGEQLVVEVGRDAVQRPRRRVALVAADDEPARLAAEVHEVVGVAQLRQRFGDAVDRLRDHVLVRHRHDRHVHAGERGDLGRVHAAREHDGLGLDGPVVGDDGADAPVAHDRGP